MATRKKAPTNTALTRALQARGRAFAQAARQLHRHAGDGKSSKHTKAEDAVHDLRVASRRLAAALSALEACSDSEDPRRLRKDVGRYTSALGDLRDTEVSLELFDELLGDIRLLGGFRDVLASRQDELARQMRRRVPESLTGRAQRAHRLVSGITPGEVAESLASELSRRASQVKRRAQALDEKTPTTYHRLRVALKKLRYLYEFLADLDATLIQKKTLGHYRTIQEALGRIQDLDVLLSTLQSGPHPPGALVKGQRRLIKHRTAALRAFRNLTGDVKQLRQDAAQTAQILRAAGSDTKRPRARK